MPRPDSRRPRQGFALLFAFFVPALLLVHSRDASAQTGALEGIVTDALTHAPIGGVAVKVSAAPWGERVVTTDALGRYASGAVPAGSYRVEIHAAADHLRKVYPDTACYPDVSCASVAGVNVAVADGATTAGVDFDLVPVGRISGRVTDAVSGVALANVFVLASPYSGGGIDVAQTRADGTYLLTVTAPVTSARVWTDKAAPYLNETYDDLACRPGCAGGTAVAVAPATITPNIDFALALGGAIAGTVSATGPGLPPVANAEIEAYDAAGVLASRVYSDATGHYQTTPLAPGSYRVHVTAAIGLELEAYPDQSCYGCGPGTGVLIPVIAGTTSAGIDFSLEDLGSLAGTVVDALSGAPLPGVLVHAYREGWPPSAGVHAVTDASGHYRVGGLHTGDYRLVTANASGHVNEVFDNIPCVSYTPIRLHPYLVGPRTGCSSDVGRRVALSHSSDVTGIDFRLARGGAISGTVRRADTGAPIEGVDVGLYSPTAGWQISATTDAAGVYTTAAVLPAGEYRLRTSNTVGYVDQIYEGVTSPGLVSLGDLSAGRLVTVADGTSTTGMDFALAMGGHVAGTLRRQDGRLLDKVRIEIYDSRGALVSRHDAGHTYRTRALPPGAYFVVAIPRYFYNGPPYVPQVYPNVTCAGCDPTVMGTAVTVTAGTDTTGIDFTFAEGGYITGRVTDAVTGLVPAGVTVEVYDAAGRLAASEPVSSIDYTVATGLPAGTYYVRTRNASGYVDEAFADTACQECALAAGTPVLVVAGNAASGIDFALVTGGRITGVVADVDSGARLANVTIEIRDETGALADRITSDVDGRYASSGLLPARYRVRTRNPWGYRDEVYDAVPCDGCAPTEGTLVDVGEGVSVVDFALVDSHRIKTATDSDGDGLPDVFELRWGLDPFDAGGLSGSSGADADDDGLTNAEEFVAGTHPRGRYRSFFAEGATSTFFDTQLALLNTDLTTPATMEVRYLRPAPQPAVVEQMSLAPLTRATIDIGSLPGFETAEVSTSVESDVPVVVDRTLSWDVTHRYGAHAETGVSTPALTWYLAEGATHSGFNLFYLLQNPNAEPATVTVRFLRPAATPLQKTYTLAPASRTNIWVNQEDFPGVGLALASTDVSASFTVTNGQPIIVERALYMDLPGQTFGAGHESAGVTQPATQWFLAEGNTGPYFDLFVLVANPNGSTAHIEATYLLPDATTVTKTHAVAGNSRFTIWVDDEDARLADTAVSTTVRSTNGVPVIVERALWWPGHFGEWYEAHNAAGTTEAGTTWALAEGEVGGERNMETFVLVANTSPTDGTIQVTVVFEDGTHATKLFTVRGNSRFNVDMRTEFPSAINRRFGTIVEATGSAPAQIVVERAMYWDADGQHWSAGTNAVAKKLR